jgi:hypothetical protein
MVVIESHTYREGSNPSPFLYSVYFIKKQAYCGRLYDALLALIVLYETIITHPSQYVKPWPISKAYQSTIDNEKETVYSVFVVQVSADEQSLSWWNSVHKTFSHK